MVTFYCFNVLKNANVRPLVGQNRPYNPTDKVTLNHGTKVNIYIVHKISKNYNISSYPTLKNCLFGAVSLTKNADIDKYKYSGYSIGFDRGGEFSFGNRLGKNCIIFGADLSSSSHANNKKNIFLFLVKILYKE